MPIETQIATADVLCRECGKAEPFTGEQWLITDYFPKHGYRCRACQRKQATSDNLRREGMLRRLAKARACRASKNEAANA